MGTPAPAGGELDADDADNKHPMGDALAAVIGRRIGRRPYTVLGSTRSLEGSAVMFLASWVATLVPLVLLAPMSPSTVVVATMTALGATAVEAVSPWGVDNLTVPAVSALALMLIS